jgi:hypothetical protein
MCGAASKAVDPYTQRRAHMKFIAYLIKKECFTHSPYVPQSELAQQNCRIANLSENGKNFGFL